MSREEALSEARRVSRIPWKAPDLVWKVPVLDDATCRTIDGEATACRDFHPGNPLHKTCLRLFGVPGLKVRR